MLLLLLPLMVAATIVSSFSMLDRAPSAVPPRTASSSCPERPAESAEATDQPNQPKKSTGRISHQPNQPKKSTSRISRISRISLGRKPGPAEETDRPDQPRQPTGQQRPELRSFSEDDAATASLRPATARSRSSSRAFCCTAAAWLPVAMA